MKLIRSTIFFLAAAFITALAVMVINAWMDSGEKGDTIQVLAGSAKQNALPIMGAIGNRDRTRPGEISEANIVTGTESVRITHIVEMAANGNGSVFPPLGSYDYEKGTEISITAIPDAGWKFDGWTGTVSDPNSLTTALTVNADRTVVANFSPAVGHRDNRTEILVHTLTIDSYEGGSVTLPGEGSFPYLSGVNVSLKAIADQGWHFTGWSGDISAIANTASPDTPMVMEGDYTVTARFEQDTTQFTLNVDKSGDGTVTPSSGSYIYDEDEQVNLTATPDEGWQFDGWSGVINNPGSPTTAVVMNSNKAVTAHFAEMTVVYTLALDSTDGGWVTTPGEGFFPYNTGTFVTIVASPEPGWEFNSWNGDVTNSGSVSTTVNVDSDKAISVSFSQISNGTNNSFLSATISVAASNAAPQSKERADYVCDGIDDNIEIQNAINAIAALPGAPGGTVFLTEGQFHTSTTIRLKNHIKFESNNGWGYTPTNNHNDTKTTIRLADNSNCDVIAGPASGDKVWFCTIANIGIDGNKKNQSSGHGINMERITRSRIYNVYIIHTKENGVHFNYHTTTSEEHVLQNVFVQRADGHSFALHAGIIKLFGCGALHTADGSFGFYIKGGQVVLNGCWVDGGTSRWGEGIMVTGNSDQVIIEGCNITKVNNYGFRIQGTINGLVMIGNTVNDCDGTAIELRTTYGDINNLIMTGNIISHCTDYSLTSVGNSGVITDSIITNNVGFDKGNRVNLNASMSNVTIEGNKGYITENSGEATIQNGNTSVIVQHGCDGIPTHIGITFTNQTTNPYGNWWISDTTETAFTLNLSNDPGLSNLDFQWESKVI